MFKTLQLTANACVAVLVIMFASASAVSATTYNYTSPTYATVNPASACTVGDCGNYSTAMRVSGSFTTSTPLAANLSNANVYSQITAYSFSDGLNTYAKPGTSRDRLATLSVSTDGAGNIIAASTTFGVSLWVSADHTTSGRVSYIGTSFTRPRHNVTCGTVGTGADGNADDCIGPTADFVHGSAADAVVGVWTVASISPVPTLSEWAMVLLGLILAGGAAVVLQRRGALAGV